MQLKNSTLRKKTVLGTQGIIKIYLDENNKYFFVTEDDGNIGMWYSYKQIRQKHSLISIMNMMLLYILVMENIYQVFYGVLLRSLLQMILIAIVMQIS